jgi:hypothetical protein
MSDICPLAAQCPIFKGFLEGKALASKAYKKQYCEAGESGRGICRRWQCKQKYGKAPDDLLPNSAKTVEEIGKENSWH